MKECCELTDILSLRSGILNKDLRILLVKLALAIFSKYKRDRRN
ncbi:hypothetical protein [Erwinia oleae]|nr:hypothetical protein [Erwinia oleae]